jgi:PAS domain S-box-containing protein
MKLDPLKILHLEDESVDRDFVEATLSNAGILCGITHVDSEQAFENALHEGEYDVIICDVALPGYDGTRALEFAAAKYPAVPFIFFSGVFDEETAVESLKRGATDYVLKRRPERLPAAVKRAVEEAETRQRMLKAQEKLREQAALINEARDAICVTDLNQCIQFWSKGAERVYGWKEAEVLGKCANDVLVQDAVALAAIKELINRGQWHGELRQSTRDGEKIVVASRWTLLRSADGKPVSILQIATDITEEKRLEAQFLRSQRMESIGALAGGIAHDLNNVLSPIIMAGEFLQMTATDPETTRFLHVIEESARRGADMVKQILAFARGNESQRGTVQIKHLVGDMARVARHTFPKSIQIETKISADVWPLLADPTQLHQVILNLCVNARDAMPEGGKLTLRVENANLQTAIEGMPVGVKLGPYVALKVVDTGTGMPLEVKERIFEPFFTTKTPDRGTGLGLSTVVTIVKDHGGFLIVESEIGKGTEFHVYLPAKPGLAPQPAEAPGSSSPMGKGQLILVVDDEASIRNIAAQALQMFGYRVVTASDGAEAVAVCAGQKDEIQLMVTDLDMPIMDGRAAIRAIQALVPGLPIIAASGIGSKDFMSDPEEPRVQAVLPKPYHADKLLRTVYSVLQGDGGKKK